MLKSTSIAIIGALAFAPVAYAKGHGQPDAPGNNGKAAAISAKGFAKSIEAQGGNINDFLADEVTVRRATTLFGNNGKGNGSDPDALGPNGSALAADHDPGVLGGNGGD